MKHRQEVIESLEVLADHCEKAITRALKSGLCSDNIAAQCAGEALVRSLDWYTRRQIFSINRRSALSKEYDRYLLQAAILRGATSPLYDFEDGRSGPAPGDDSELKRDLMGLLRNQGSYTDIILLSGALVRARRDEEVLSGLAYPRGNLVTPYHPTPQRKSER